MTNKCTSCGETATREVTHLMVGSLGAHTARERFCRVHAREYVVNFPHTEPVAKLLAMTTSVMPAPIRTAHTKDVLEDNAVEAKRVTSEHAGPTYVTCEPESLAETKWVLRAQGWGVATSPGNVLVVDHPQPGQKVAEEPTPINDAGIARAMNHVRVDEIDFWLKQIAEHVTYGSTEHLTTAMRARRAELTGDGLT